MVILILCFDRNAIKNKMQTSQYRKSRIWEMKEGKYTKSLAKSQPAKCCVTQKPGNSSVFYRKLKNPLEPKICVN